MSKKISQLPDLRLGGAGYLPAAVNGVTVRVPMDVAGAGVGTDAQNTAAIQAAIDAAHATYLAGGGITRVRLPAASIPLAVSTAPDVMWNFGGPVLASEGCLIMRDGVWLQGAGIEQTKLRPNTPSLTCINMCDGNNQIISDLEIDGQSVASAEVGHGILQVLSANDNSIGVENVRIENVFVRRVGSYGCGIQNGNISKLLIRNFSTYRTGADGIDIKNRGTLEDDKGFRLENIYIDTFGLRLDDQAGIDIRGICNISGVQVLNAGRAGVQQSAIRFRPRDIATTESWARRSTLHGFYVRGVDATYNTHGVWIGCPDAIVDGGVTEKCLYGVRLVGEGGDTVERAHVSNVAARGAPTGTGFLVDDTYGAAAQNTFTNCTAEGMNVGFDDRGSYTTLVATKAYNCTTNFAATAGALLTQCLAANTLGTSFLSLLTSNVNSPAIEARGSTTNVDIWIKPKGTGRVQFGTRTASGDVPVTGYVEILDAGGTIRRLAVVG